MKFLFVYGCLFLSSFTLLSQKQNNNWLFGDKAGLNFNTLSPASIASSMVALEGSSAISDADGQLLFYSDGINVWDRNHNVMPNGANLLGGASSTQAALIVPLPGSQVHYFLFTTESEFSYGRFTYSIVDMSLNGGLGDVVLENKNTIVNDSIGERVTAVLHNDKESIWIITHDLISNNFYSYLLTAGGFDNTPVISSVGSFYTTTKSAAGHVKASHDGTQIICSSSHLDILELFDFDSETGRLSHAVNLMEYFPESVFFYGLEFSPSDSLLYLTSQTFITYLYQLDLYNFQVTILNSDSDISYGSLLLGPDQRIYIAKLFSSTLDIIEFPNLRGSACNFIPNAILLKDSTRSLIGLPNLPPYALFPDTSHLPTLGSDRVLCNGESLLLELDLSLNCFPISYLWNDGSTFSTLIIDQPGEYWVELNTTCGSFFDTIYVDSINCLPVIHYDLNSCTSYMSDGSHMDFSEFIPSYPNSLSCGLITGSNIFRITSPTNKHSCTPGINNSEAMCVNVYDTCAYVPGHESALVSEIIVNPDPGFAVLLTGLSFYEKGPNTYNWIDGDSGSNNYPTKFGIRILKNGNEIFRKENISTDLEWHLHHFDFIAIDSFLVTDISVFRVEWFAYCPIGNGAIVSAWDLDEISLFGTCTTVMDNFIVKGKVLSYKDMVIPHVEVLIDSEENFEASEVQTTNDLGEYTFILKQKQKPFWIKGYSNQNVKDGISTLDLLYIQRHLLGISPFTGLYQLIAADINKSGDITLMDLIDLRKIILGIDKDFKHNTSWRFGLLPCEISSKDFSKFKEIGNILSWELDTQKVNFVGIKVGDLDGSFSRPQPADYIELRSTVPLKLVVEKNSMNTYLHFSFGEGIEISGLQFALVLEKVSIKDIESQIIGDLSENFSFKSGIFKFSWNCNDQIKFRAGETIFTLSIEPLANNININNIYFNNYELSPEAYLNEFQTVNLHLDATLSSELYMKTDCPNMKAWLNDSYLNVKFCLLNEEIITVLILDELGKCIQGFTKNYLAGDNSTKININNFASGVYYCKFHSNEFSNVQPFIIYD